LDINITIKELLIKLELGDLIEEPTRIMGGLLNKLYKVSTTKGIYAVKHLNPKLITNDSNKEHITLTEKIASKAKENGLNCIPAMEFNNMSIQECNNSFFLIFEWFEGTNISNSKISKEHVREVATILAQIHNIDFGELKHKCNKPNKDFEVNWNYYVDRVEMPTIKEFLLKYKDKLYEIDKKSSIAVSKIKSEMVVSHKDLDILNVIWSYDFKPYIIDWELAGLVNPCEEAIETAWNWSGGHEYYDATKFYYFLDTYKTNGGNLTDINKAIYSCFKNNSEWLEYNLKRSCGINCSDNEERQIGEKEAIRVIKKIIKFYEIMSKEF